METIEAEFTQVTPSSLPGTPHIPSGWFVISHTWVGDKKTRREVHGHWFRIKSPKGQIYRILRFSPNLEGGKASSEGEMVVDWPGWLELNGYEAETAKSLVLELEEAGWWRFPQLVLSHPDPVYRLSGYLGLLSVALGLLSLILAL